VFLCRREHLPDGILYTSQDSHYSIFKIAIMYRMKCVKVRTLISGEIDCADLKAQVLAHKEKPAIINLNIGLFFSLTKFLSRRMQNLKMDSILYCRDDYERRYWWPWSCNTNSGGLWLHSWSILYSLWWSSVWNYVAFSQTSELKLDLNLRLFTMKI